MKFLRVTTTAWLVFLAAFWLLSAQSLAQEGYSPNVKSIQYFYRVSRFPAFQPDSTVLHFYFAIPYKNLIFIARDSVFETGIRFGLFLLDEQRNTVFERNWSQKINVRSFAETSSDSAYSRFSTATTVSAGNYIVVMESVDDNISVPQYNEFKMKVPSHKGQQSILGDVLLFGALYDFSKLDFTQLLPIPGNICRNDFTLVSEAVLLEPIQDLAAEAVWYSKNRVIRTDPMVIARKENKLTLFLAYPIKSLQQGQFVVQVRLTGRNMKSRNVELPIEIIKQVELYSEENLNQAIEQMNYIGEGPAWDSLKTAKDFTSKKYWFAQFWRDYYPAADSLSNPVQDEYFRRVQFTIREFGGGMMPGWRSDRGRIYLIYGPPDEVQQEEDSMMRNYQIWIYDRLKKRFVFFEEHASGYYRLIQVQ